MLAIIATVLFALAAIIEGSATHTSAWLSPLTLLCVGLACLALHLSGRVRS
jgi:hypothetical protein